MTAKFSVRSILIFTSVAACILASIVWLRQLRDPERLTLAAYRGNLEDVRFYLLKGVQPTVQDGWRGTPLMYASGQGHLEIVVELLEAGVDINERSRMQRTPLMWAARGGQYEVAEFLIARSANRSLLDSDGLTAAQIARNLGHDNIRKLLSE